MATPILPLLLVLPLAACASIPSDQAPSLAKRPVEGQFNVAPPTAIVEPPGPLPADLAGRLARWDADASKAQQAFAAERAVTLRAVDAARGARVASENWVVAQQAISRLQATRAPLTAALADIDRLYVQRSVDEAIDGLPDIFALRERLTDLVAGQDAVIQALSRQLPQ